jgi:E3 ubiquitin-protein ligase RNF19A
MTNPQLLMNYERFMIRAVLIKEADTRKQRLSFILFYLCFKGWCPGQDCDYAVVANSCAACPKLECERAECGTLFCYHCKGEWHANQTCDEARGKSMDRMFASASNGLNRSNSLTEIIGAASSSTNEPFKRNILFL